MPTKVAELVIAHAQPGLHRVYDLHKYRDEKRRALDLWANKLLVIVDGAKSRKFFALCGHQGLSSNARRAISRSSTANRSVRYSASCAFPMTLRKRRSTLAGGGPPMVCSVEKMRAVSQSEVRSSCVLLRNSSRPSREGGLLALSPMQCSCSSARKASVQCGRNAIHGLEMTSDPRINENYPSLNRSKIEEYRHDFRRVFHFWGANSNSRRVSPGARKGLTVASLCDTAEVLLQAFRKWDTRSDSIIRNTDFFFRSHWPPEGGMLMASDEESLLTEQAPGPRRRGRPRKKIHPNSWARNFVSL